MATKQEKIFGSIAGLIIGAIAGYLLAESKKIKDEDRWKHLFGGAVLGGLSGYAASNLLGTKNDTVNYQLMKGNKTVYHGITFKDRIDQRKLEHIKDGKKFSNMVIDSSKPREDALFLEKRLIKRDKPKYNIQHNK